MKIGLKLKCEVDQAQHLANVWRLICDEDNQKNGKREETFDTLMYLLETYIDSLGDTVGYEKDLSAVLAQCHDLIRNFESSRAFTP